jgi:hypothetical protein
MAFKQLNLNTNVANSLEQLYAETGLGRLRPPPPMETVTPEIPEFNAPRYSLHTPSIQRKPLAVSPTTPTFSFKPPRIITPLAESKSVDEVPQNAYVPPPRLATTGQTGVFDPEAIQQATIYKDQNGLWTSDDPFTRRLIQLESGGYSDAVAGYKKDTGRYDPKRRAETAAGLFQITGSTGESYGIIGDDRFDPEKALTAYKRITASNIKQLQKYGIPITPLNLYLAYNQGVGGTIHILNGIKYGTGITNPKIQKNMNFNRHGVPWNAAPEVWLKGMEDWASF